MSAPSATTLAPRLKTANSDRPAATAVPAGSMANPKPKRSLRRLVILLAVGLLLLTGGTFWYIDNVGYETTDDAAIEGHVIQVSPKLSAHVKAVHFDDNYQVKRGDLLIELDPRDFEVSLASAVANLDSAQSKLVEAETKKSAGKASLGQARADLVSAEATADNAKSDLKRNERLFQTHVIDRRE